MRPQALQVSDDNLEAAVALLRRARTEKLESDLLCCITLTLGLCFKVLHGHMVCLHEVPKDDLVAAVTDLPLYLRKVTDI